ncbi:hypothetical protein GGF39_003858 [Coemansia sp. RSA 1721]|nr:hypothetical protein GGF39_003858 [Coemansia sp. RSA 1721]
MEPTGMDQQTCALATYHPERVAIRRRAPERPQRHTAPKIGIVYSVEYWSLVEPLVNELRYELSEKYQYSPINIKVTQTESIHDIPTFITNLHQRSELVFAVGVALKSSDLYEERLVDLLTQRISSIVVPGRLPVFDCILVRDSKEEVEGLLEIQGGASGLVEKWARRAMDTYAQMLKAGM